MACLCAGNGQCGEEHFPPGRGWFPCAWWYSTCRGGFLLSPAEPGLSGQWPCLQNLLGSGKQADTQTVMASKQTRHNPMWGCDCDSPVGLYLVHNYHIYYDIYIYILENVCLVLKLCPSVSLSGWLSSQEECDWLYTPFQSVQCSGWWTSRQSRGPALLWWGNRDWGILCWHRACGLRCGLYIVINMWCLSCEQYCFN